MASLDKTSNNGESLGIWSLGMWFLRRVRFPIKLGLLAAIILLPMVLVALRLFISQAEAVASTNAEIEGLKVIKPTVALVTQLQKHRGQNSLVLAGNAAVIPARDETRRLAVAALVSVDAAVASVPGLKLDSDWNALRQRAQALTTDQPGAKAAESFKLHTDAVQALQQFIYLLADRSTLLFDPEPAPYMLMDALVSRIGPWSEQIGQLRGMGAAHLVAATPDLMARSGLLARADRLTQTASDSKFILSLLTPYDNVPLGVAEAIENSLAFTSASRAAFGVDAPSSDSVAYFTVGTRAIEAVLAVNAKLQDRLEFLLLTRADKLQQERTLLAVALLGGIALLAYLMICFYRTFSIDLGRLSYALTQVSQGNLRVKATVRGRDEIGDLANLLQVMIRNVSAMVAAVGSDSALVAYAGRNLSEGNEDLANRTEQQAANLEQTAASVQELASTVQQNAESAKAVDLQAVQVRTLADEGAQSMTAAIISVEAIQQSAQRMSDIISVIDSLAFQTNILALNAAVEAARAGEQGRGFAVVASEVRLLAKRSAESAKEIRQLIQASTAQVGASVGQIRVAGERIAQIVNGIREVATTLSHISTANAEQSAGIKEISQAVMQLDEITQRNGEMVERAVRQSHSLEQRASTLTEMASEFKLLQGTAYEASALMDNATAYRSTCSSKDAFLRGLTDASNGFCERDMYVFALNASGTYLAFAGNPAKINTRVQDVPGIDGDGLIHAIVTQAEEQPGWVLYDITNPTTGTVQTKMSFVRRIDDVYVGCGVYKSLA